MKKNINAYIVFSRVSGGVPGEEISINIEDVDSGLTILRGYMTRGEFADAITNKYSRMKIAHLNDNERIGMKQEVLTAIVHIVDHPGKASDGEIAAHVAPFEINGWEADVKQFRNQHYFELDEKSGGYNVKVTLRRWVKRDTENGD